MLLKKKNRNNSKKQKWSLIYIAIFLIIPLIYIFTCFYCIYKENKFFSLVPNSKVKTTGLTQNYNLKKSSDIIKIVSPKKVKIEYYLNENCRNQVAGVLFDSKNALKISNKDSIKLEIKGNNPSPMLICFRVFVHGITKKNIDHSYLTYESSFLIEKDFSEFIFHANEFVIPSWWYNINNITSEDKRLPTTLNFINAIQIQNIPGTSQKTSGSFTITKLYIYKNHIPFIKTATLVFILYFFLMILFFYLKSYRLNKQRKESITIFKSLEPVEITPEDIIHSKDLTVIKYIGENFNQPNLTANIVSQNCNVQQHQLSRILKKRFSLTFIQYLNTIRLEEAKRLLKQTDKNINIIANQVGFNNAEHFARLFKRSENTTPGKYKKQHQLKVY